VIVGALALVGAMTLTACGGPTNPRLESVAAQRPAPATTPPDVPVQPVPDPPAPGEAPCPPGKFQLEIEQALAKIGNYGPITVDGVQSAQDCATISAFQKRMGIGTWAGMYKNQTVVRTDDEAPDGTPGERTRLVAERIAATDPSQCPYSLVPQACVDLTHQTFYVVSEGKVILGPTVTRTGMAGFSTPAGKFRIGFGTWNRTTEHYSWTYNTPLPYWQRFYSGAGLHTTTTYIHHMWRGSHGCVNLIYDDSVAAYELMSSGSYVYLYGRRPGT
jgi:lipoprotein-anchoring transpeptidase ErfK/SrfK